MSRILKFAFNQNIIDKVEKGNKAQFKVLTDQFENVENTLKELSEIIHLGHPFCAQHNGTRQSANFICSDVLAVDIDDGMTLDEARNCDFVKRFGGFIYITPSHTDEKHRFRIVFETERTIYSSIEMTEAYRGLIRIFGSDESCKDACRLFYGSKDSNPIFLGNVLSNEELGRLILLGRESIVPQNKKVVGHAKLPSFVNNNRTLSRTSEIKILSNQLITCYDGQVLPFEAIPIGTTVHCPIQLIDRNPSAFIVGGSQGGRAIYCHSCASTFWDSKARPAFKFNTTEDIIKGMYIKENPLMDFHEQDFTAPSYPGLHGDSRSTNIISKQYISADDVAIHPGATFICSEKGSGKTQLLAENVEKFKSMNLSILLIGHRVNLLKNMAARYKMTSYIDLDNNFIKNRPTKYFAVCVDSMHRLLQPLNHKYDVVIIDESEQFFTHLTGDTLKGKRKDTCSLLFHYLSVAKYVLVSDADLGAITIEALHSARGPHAPYHFYLNDNRSMKSQRRDFNCYLNKAHLITEMLNAIATGGRYYIVTNSINFANVLREIVRLFCKADLKTILVTSETQNEKDVQNFTASISLEILKYDVVIASPTLGTGIDISFEHCSQQIDTVYGFFVPHVNTHFDIDQQLSRVRNPKAIKVWITTETFFFETEKEAILREAELNEELSEARLSFKPDGSTVWDENYLNIHAQVMSISRASKNNLKKNLLDLREYNGWNLVSVETDTHMQAAGNEAIKRAKKSVRLGVQKSILEADIISDAIYKNINKNKVNDNTPLNHLIQRHEIESFYCDKISDKLVELDDSGHYREKLIFIEDYLQSPNEITSNNLEPKLGLRLEDQNFRVSRNQILKEALFVAGLSDDVNPIKSDIEINSVALKRFITFCHGNESRLEKVLKVKIRSDLQKRPMMQLGAILNIIGLSLEKVRTKKIAKSKINYYKISSDQWSTAQHYIELRKMAARSRLSLL